MVADTDSQSLLGNYGPKYAKIRDSIQNPLKLKLLDWNVAAKEYFRTDLEEGTLKAGGKVVLKASIVEGKIALDWVDPTWSDWKELVESAELKDLQSAAFTRPDGAHCQSRCAKGGRQRLPTLMGSKTCWHSFTPCGRKRAHAQDSGLWAWTILVDIWHVECPWPD